MTDPDGRRATGPTTRSIVAALLRAMGSTAALLTVYYLLPLDRSSTGFAVTTVAAGLVVFIALVAFQVRTIIASPFPGLRAVEALGTSIPFFLLLFASTYVLLAGVSNDNFGTPLNQSDALYFTVTVFTTVGFGDITAKTDAARLVVTGQMVADLVVVGLGIKVIIEAVKRGHRRRVTEAGEPPRDTGS
jgi:voltage-gated potassium channel